VDTLEVNLTVEVEKRSGVGESTREYSACRSTVTQSFLLC
jgi:hypothetical protein